MKPHIDPISGTLTIYECNEVCPQCHKFNFLSYGYCPVCGFVLSKEIYEYAHGITTVMPEEWKRRVAEKKARAAEDQGAEPIQPITHKGVPFLHLLWKWIVGKNDSHLRSVVCNAACKL